jgi:integrase
MPRPKIQTNLDTKTEDACPRNRLTPIAGTKHTINGYPKKLIIYKTDASRFYWVRVYFNGRYHTKSTKTDSITDAKKFAVKYYEDVLVSSRTNNLSDTNRSFAKVSTRYFKSVENSTNHRTYQSDFSRYRSDLLPHFAEQEVDSITNAQISDLIQKLKKRDLSTATVKHYMVVLRKILKFAIANDLMRQLPVFPKISGRLTTTQKRDYLTQTEYKNLVKSAEKLAQREETSRGTKITLDMKYLIQFMVNSFIRPSDLRVIKHKHVKIRREEQEEWLTLSHSATKTVATEIQAMPSCVPLYKKIVDYRKQNQEAHSPDDYLFLPAYENRNTAIEIIGRLFRRIVEETNLKKEADKNITLYSLRHTAIMFRLIIGNVSTLALARNARTSQAMIDKYYASHLTTDQVRKQLHFMPEPKRSKNL